jgi:hypothetical protein
VDGRLAASADAPLESPGTDARLAREDGGHLRGGSTLRAAARTHARAAR